MDQTNERILTELADIRRTVEEIKIVEENRLLEDGLLRTLEFSTQMAIIIIQDSKFKYVSRQTENQWGYTLEDLIDRDVMSAVYPDDRQQMRESAIKMLKGQRSTPFAFRALTKNGAIRWITETVASISYHGRRAVMANYMDITEQIESRKRLEELEAREASILEAMPNAVIGLRTGALFSPMTASNQSSGGRQRILSANLPVSFTAPTRITTMWPNIFIPSWKRNGRR